MDYELNMALVSTNKENGKKYSFYPVNIVAVFNGNSGENISAKNGAKQRLETIEVQLKFAKNLKEKLQIFWRGRKVILKNLSQFC